MIVASKDKTNTVLEPDVLEELKEIIDQVLDTMWLKKENIRA